MAVIAIVDGLFLIPAVGAFKSAVSSLSSLGTLTDLVAVVFSSAWLLGWSVAPLLLTLLLVVMLTGREVVRGKQQQVELGIGLPGIMLWIAYDLSRVQDLRLVTPEPKSGTAWRGTHLAFDYDGYQIDFGSAMTPQQLESLRQKLDSQRNTKLDNYERGVDEPAVSERISPKQNENVGNILTRSKRDKSPITPDTAPDVPADSISLVMLVLMNLIPVYGWWQWGWQLSDVMVLYWAESAIIGFFNLLKLAIISRWLIVVVGPFFLGHFSGFMAVHFLFVYSIFVQGVAGQGPGESIPEVVHLFYSLRWALLGLFISHGLSFVQNYLRHSEYRNKTIKVQMMEPYGRIMLMHLVLIFGGFVALLLGDAGPVILLMILVKIAADSYAHLRQRRSTR